MKQIIMVAAALAFVAGTAVAQDKSVTEKIKAAGDANAKATADARAKKRAEEDARSAANKAERDKNPPGSTLQKQVKETAKGVQEMQEKNKDAKAPRR
jgi:hypothetical protein